MKRALDGSRTDFVRDARINPPSTIVISSRWQVAIAVGHYSFNSKLPEVKVMFTSGFPDHVEVQGRGEGPGIFFLPKPYSPAVLAAKVREVLDAPGPKD